MLQPTRTKYRKAFKGRIKGKASRAVTLNYGQFRSSLPSDWEVAEIIVFDRVLNTGEIEQVERELAYKYNIDITL